MKVRLDENIPARLIPVLERMGHSVESVAASKLQGRADAEIWQAVRKEGALFITQDLDFSDLRRFTPGTHPGILLVRLREPGRQALFERLRALFENEDVESWKGCFVVATDRKLRIRRPKI